jgi:2-keto-4-pentenoate hydratase
MSTDRFVVQLADAIKAKSIWPEFPSGVTLTEAYSLIPHLTSLISGEQSAGIKAGVTNRDLQALFGLEEPLLGLLYQQSEIENAATLPHTASRRIECELAMQLNSDGNPISIGPAVEFVRLDFCRPEDLTPGNVTLCNLGADQFILGDMGAWDSFDFTALADIEIELMRDGEVILTASPLDSFGGPKPALDWCVNKANSLEFTIPEGGVLLAGTNGAAIEADPGHYQASYGPLGTIEFTIA